MIELCNITVVKASRRLFNDFQWSIRQGEHWVIGGPNGSGKTTLLETIAGVTNISHGRINYSFIQDGSWDELYSQRKNKIHYIPTHAIQSFLHDHTYFYQQRYYAMGDERMPTVRDVLGTSSKQLDQLSLSSSFDIDQLLELPIGRLSNGQLKKVLILKNLAQSLPKVLLLDYPFEGLDFDSREELIRFLDHIAINHNIQLIIVDDHHHLPTVITNRLVLEKFRIKKVEKITTEAATPIAMTKTLEHAGAEVIVEMKDVTIRYDEKVIIKNFNWKIHRGERWALTGKNGSGKTTLFSLIYADHPMAYSEQVFLFGKRRGSGESIWDIKKRINYLGPELLTFLNPKSILISAREYILSQNAKVEAAIVESTIRFFQAEEFITDAVRSLSSGQLQLMLLMSCLLSDKELLLLDEPFQFLDSKQKENLNAFLHTHLHPETTLVLITHYEHDIVRWTQHRKSV